MDIRPVLRLVYDRVAALRIASPDPDAYDRGFNDAIRRALTEIVQADSDTPRP